MMLRGFPGPLPAGETLVWQGAPDWRILARTAMHTRGLAIYFVILAVVAAITGRVGGAFTVAGLGLVPLALAYAYAWLVGRSTVYSITNRRVVLHIGLALPVTLNLPLAQVASADLLAARDGSGDLALTLSGEGRFAYLVLWPHARPWRLSPAQPTMRGLADAQGAASALASVLAAGTPVKTVVDPHVDMMQTPLAA